MPRKTGALCLATVAAVSCPGAIAQTDLGEQFAAGVRNGSAALDLRYRFEQVDAENFRRDARASTLRSRLTLTSAPVSDFIARLEFDNVSVLGADDYNSTENGQTRYPVVADPEGTEVNQAWLKWQGEAITGTYGRQRITLGRQRFIGARAWRQNEQTYDGLRAVATAGGDKLTLDASYVYNINRPTGPDDGGNPANLGGDNLFLRLNYAPGEGQDFTLFGYDIALDAKPGFPDRQTADLSSRNLGAEYQGKFEHWQLTAAYARQTDTGESSLDYSADYRLVEGGTTLAGIDLMLGWEVLGGGDGVGFQTPLAALHKFNGWADQFSTTPRDGLEDLYLSAATRVGPVSLAAIYHDFKAEDSSADYGTEWDFAATWTLNEQFSVAGHYARFDADGAGYSDVEKLWLIVALKL